MQGIQEREQKEELFELMDYLREGAKNGNKQILNQLENIMIKRKLVPLSCDSYFRNGDIKTCSICDLDNKKVFYRDDATEKKVDNLYRNCQKKYYETEKDYENRIAKDLKRKKIKFTKQKKTPLGVIDIFIDTIPPSIIEIKADSDKTKIQGAIGQLVYYSYIYPEAKLFIAIPEFNDPEIEEVLGKWHIKIWRENGN